MHYVLDFDWCAITGPRVVPAGLLEIEPSLLCYLFLNNDLKWDRFEHLTRAVIFAPIDRDAPDRERAVSGGPVITIQKESG